MPKVFVSHDHKDFQLVKREVVDFLIAQGIDIWMSEDAIRIGRKINREILCGLRSCEFVLVAITEHSVQSEWVASELEWTLDKAPEKLIPVLLEDCDLDSLSLRLRRTLLLDWRDRGEHCRQKLLQEIERRVDVGSANGQGVPSSVRPPCPNQVPYIFTSSSGIGEETALYSSGDLPSAGVGWNFLEYEIRRAEVTKLIVQCKRLLESLEVIRQVQAISDLLAQLWQETFSVCVIGNPNRGRSELLQAFMGLRVLPPEECWHPGISSEFKWGVRFQGRLFFRSAIAFPLSRSLPERICDHIRQFDGQTPPPLGFDVIDGRALAESGRFFASIASVAQRVEMFVPAPVLLNGLQFVDAPVAVNGIDFSEAARRADAVIFATNCSECLSDSEIKCIEQLRFTGYEDIFIACNGIGSIPKEEQFAFQKYVRRQLCGMTSLGEQGIYFVSGWETLNERLDSTITRRFNPGMIVFERRVTDFLISDRGNARLSRHLSHVRQLLKSGWDLAEATRKQAFSGEIDALISALKMCGNSIAVERFGL